MEINDLNILLADHESKKKLLSFLFKDGKEITSLKSFISKLEKHKNDKSTSLSEDELTELRTMVITNLNSAKLDVASRELFVNVLLLLGGYHIQDILKADKAAAKEEKAAILCNVIRLLENGNFLTPAILKWVIEFEGGRYIYSYKKLESLNSALSLMEKYKALNKTYLPLFLVYPHIHVMEELVRVINSPDVSKKSDLLAKISSFYFKQPRSSLFASEMEGKNHGDIYSFFHKLMRLELLTPDILNTILSTTHDSNGTVSNIDLIITLDVICRTLESGHGDPRCLEYNSFICKNFNSLMQIFSEDEMMRSIFCVNALDLLTFYRVIKNHLPILLAHIDIFGLFNALLMLENNKMLTEENVNIIKEDVDLCLIQHLPKNKTFYNTTMIIQDPLSIVQFDKQGIKKDILSSSDLQDLEIAPLLDKYFKVTLQPNEVRSIKFILRGDFGDHAQIRMWLDASIKAKDGYELGSKSNAKARMLVLLQQNDILNPSNLAIVKNHTKIENICWISRKISRRADLTQPVFDSIVKHENILFQNNFFERIPDHMLTADVFNIVLQHCEEAQGNIQQARTRIANYANQLLGINATTETMSYAQNTHNKDVHQSVSDSAKELKKHYGSKIKSPDALRKIIDEIKEWANTLPDTDTLNLEETRFDKENRMLIDDLLEVTDEAAAKEKTKSEDIKDKKRYVPLESKLATAKRAIFNRGVLELESVDKGSGITMTEMFALYWLAGHDDELRDKHTSIQEIRNIIADALYQTQREYRFVNDPEGSNFFYEVGGEDKPGCIGGTFNKLTEKFAPIHLLVKLRYGSIQLAEWKLPFVVKNVTKKFLSDLKTEKLSNNLSKEFNSYLDKIKEPQNGVEFIWNEINKQIKEKMKEEFLSAFSNSVQKLEEFVDNYGKYVSIDSLLDEMRITDQLSKEEVLDTEILLRDSTSTDAPTQPTNTVYIQQNALLSTVHRENIERKKQVEVQTQVLITKESKEEETDEVAPSVPPAIITPNDKKMIELNSLHTDLEKWLTDSETQIVELSQRKIPFNKEFDAARYFITELIVRLQEIITGANVKDASHVIYLKLPNKKIELDLNNADDIYAAMQCYLKNHRSLNEVTQSYLNGLIKTLEKHCKISAWTDNKYWNKFFKPQPQTSMSAESKTQPHNQVSFGKNNR